MSYWRCFYHIVWTTRDRIPVLTDDLHEQLGRLTMDACRELGVLVHAMGGVEDHIHVLVSIPPRHAVSDVVQRIKGTTSHVFAKQTAWPGWQGEYGVLTIGERSLDDVKAYVLNQQQHHRDKSLLPAFETIDRRELTPG